MKRSLLVLSLWISIILCSSGAMGSGIDISFKEVDIEDALRGLAEIGGVNVIIHSNLEGKVSLHLKEMTFEKAWEGLLYAYDLDYLEKENLYIVGEPDWVQSLKEEKLIRSYPVKGENKHKLEQMLSSLFPDLRVGYGNEKVFLLGKEREIEKAENLVTDFQAKKPEKETLILSLNHLDGAKAEKIIGAFFPELDLICKNQENIILMKGEKKTLKEAENILAELERKSPSQRLTDFPLQFGNPGEVKRLLESIFDNIKVEVDNRLNLLLIRAEEEELSEIENIIKKMDQPRPLVVLEVRVEEVSAQYLTHDEWPWEQRGEIKILKDNSLIELAGKTLDCFLNQMEKEGISETLARPSLSTIDGVEGNLLIGDRIPVPRERNNNIEVEYLEAGIIISFKPRVAENGYITLEVRPEVSTIGEEVFSGFPRIRTREAETIVRIRSGETLALGGLIQTQDRLQKSGASFWEKLPVLGSFFSGHQEDKVKTELVIFITPRIIEEENKLETEKKLPASQQRKF